jgi:hypothetical protein
MKKKILGGDTTLFKLYYVANIISGNRYSKKVLLKSTNSLLGNFPERKEE